MLGFSKKESRKKETMSNTNEHQSSSGGFLNGLLLGFLIGGGAVFLFGTKKGKRLLKLITEEGLEGISELENFIEDEVAYDEPIVPQKVRTPVVSRRHEQTSSNSAHATTSAVREIQEFEEEGEMPEVGSLNKTRRLFKGIRKR